MVSVRPPAPWLALDVSLPDRRDRRRSKNSCAGANGGGRHLGWLRGHRASSGKPTIQRRSALTVSAVFVFIGATPCTNWLDEQMAMDPDSSLTGHDVARSAGHRMPLTYETKMPGVFCVGDAAPVGSRERVRANEEIPPSRPQTGRRPGLPRPAPPAPRFATTWSRIQQEPPCSACGRPSRTSGVIHDPEHGHRWLDRCRQCFLETPPTLPVPPGRFLAGLRGVATDARLRLRTYTDESGGGW